MSRQSFFIAAAMAVGLAAASAPAQAAGDSKPAPAGLQCGEGLVPDSQGQTCVPCEQGKVYDKKTKTCIASSTRLFDDDELYVTGRELALAGRYEDALDILGAVADKDAMTLTMIGYATRKLGRTDEGIAIYHQALALDPDNLNTHEYLGEGYLAAGRIDLAELQLDVLERLCGVDCEQYQDLNKAILGEPIWN